MAFDGIITKKVVDELNNLISYKIDKIYEPDGNTIILGLYGNFRNVALLICISSNNYRIHLTNHTIKNPDIAPNFCMLLRKHILGYRIKKIYTKGLERIVYIDLENDENPEKPIYKSLIVEIMGKHSNIILNNSNDIIIDSLRHTSTEENAQRDVCPTARYIAPESNKLNFLELKCFDDFYKVLELNENTGIMEEIVNRFNGIGYTNLKNMVEEIQKENMSPYMSSKLLIHKIYDKIESIIDSKYVKIIKKDKDFFIDKDEYENEYKLNFLLDDYYYEKESNELFTNYRNTILNLILATLKKYEKRLENMDNKLEECKEMDKYKLYGELITANLYKLPSYNVEEISVENYYDNNKIININLNKKYSPQQNASRFFKKYNKLKNASIIVNEQKTETIQNIKYIESIIYELENCTSINDVQQIYEEISENDIFKLKLTHKKNYNKKSMKAKKMTSNKFVTFNPLKYNIDGYTIYVGRNNKENDYLTNKFANKKDLWFHTKDIHGSHVILKKDFNHEIPEYIIMEAAKLAASHSKAKNSSNIPVDYCEVSFVKKVPGNKPGLVTYRNNKTIFVHSVPVL